MARAYAINATPTTHCELCALPSAACFVFTCLPCAGKSWGRLSVPHLCFLTRHTCKLVQQQLQQLPACLACLNPKP